MELGYCDCCGAVGKTTLCEIRDNIYDTFIDIQNLCVECVETKTEEYTLGVLNYDNI